MATADAFWFTAQKFEWELEIIHVIVERLRADAIAHLHLDILTDWIADDPIHYDMVKGVIRELALPQVGAFDVSLSLVDRPSLSGLPHSKNSEPCSSDATG